MGDEGPTFHAITGDTNCDCLNAKAVDDHRAIFCRRLQSIQVRLEDFQSYWECSKRPQSPPTAARHCKEVCGLKGVSVHRFTTREELKEHFAKTLRYAPAAFKRTPYYCKIRLASSGGKVIYSPSSKDPEHCDLLKADGFTIRKLVIVEVEEIEKCLR
jgi:hypothetical protein